MQKVPKISPYISHDQTRKVASNYMPRTVEVPVEVTENYQRKRIITRVLFAVNR